MLTEQVRRYAQQALLDALSPADCGPHVDKVNIGKHAIHVHCSVFGTEFQIDACVVDDPEDLKWCIHWSDVIYPMHQLPCLLLTTLANKSEEMYNCAVSINNDYANLLCKMEDIHVN